MSVSCPSLASAPPAPRAIASLPFPAPGELDPRLGELLEGVSALLCRWLASAEQRPPLPGLSLLPPVEPQAQGLDTAALLDDLQLVMDGAYNPSHPGALAHLDPPALPASVAGDLIAAGLNNNLLAEELSPSLTRLERSLTGWLAEAIGLPGGSAGVAASGGTLSNLMALVTARHARGLATEQQAVVLASTDAHVSLRKAVSVMGLPSDALRGIPVDHNGRLRVDALDATLMDLQRGGIPVIAVVATAGTTVRGAVDPLAPIAALCRRHGHWLHVDGAIGAVFALADSHRHRLQGLGLADSITVNPQKVLGITKTSSLLLLAEPQQLEAPFRTGLPYMEPSWGGVHGGEWGLQGTRPAEILKLWLGLRQLGLDGVAAVLDGAISRQERLQNLLGVDERLQLCVGDLHLLAFTPKHHDAAAAERWSLLTRQTLLAEQLMLSRPQYQGRHHLKAVLGNPYTQPHHLEHLAELVLASLEDQGHG
jgi:L-2,4-diaminobutyrate decarboxylase